jgi:hypothetical protein
MGNEFVYEASKSVFAPSVRVDDVRSSGVLMERISSLVETLRGKVESVVLSDVLDGDAYPEGAQKIDVDPVMNHLQSAVLESGDSELDAEFRDIWFQLANVGDLISEMMSREKFNDAVAEFSDATEGENAIEPVRGFYMHFANRCQGACLSDLKPIFDSLRAHKTKFGPKFFSMILNNIKDITFEDLKNVLRLMVEVDCDFDSDAKFINDLTRLRCTTGKGKKLRIFVEGLISGKENGFGSVTLDRIKWALVEDRF